MNKENPDNYSDKIDFSVLYKNTAAVSLIWLVLIVAIALWGIYNEQNHIREIAENEAGSAHNKDLARACPNFAYFKF